MGARQPYCGASISAGHQNHVTSSDHDKTGGHTSTHKVIPVVVNSGNPNIFDFKIIYSH